MTVTAGATSFAALTVNAAAGFQSRVEIKAPLPGALFLQISGEGLPRTESRGATASPKPPPFYIPKRCASGSCPLACWEEAGWLRSRAELLIFTGRLPRAA